MLYVYFIQAGTHGPIKIGVAVDPEHRRARFIVPPEEEA